MIQANLHWPDETRHPDIHFQREHHYGGRLWEGTRVNGILVNNTVQLMSSRTSSTSNTSTLAG